MLFPKIPPTRFLPFGMGVFWSIIKRSGTTGAFHGHAPKHE
jgi:hypothetical protein